MSRFSQPWIFFAGYLIALPLQAVLPLRDQWRAGCDALAANQPVRALALFREFDHWYAAESGVAEPDFRETRIRLWGLAALQSGELAEAAQLLERWLTENSDQQRFRAFLRFQLAGIYQILGNLERTEIHRQAFLEEHPELPESALIHWARADEALSRKDFSEARQNMALVAGHESLPESGRELAEAALATIELATGNLDQALVHLSTENPGKTSRVLDFWKSLMAPSLVQQLLAADSPEAAREAAQWFDDPKQLQSRLSTFRESMNSNQRSSGLRQSIWNRQWTGQLGRLEAALKQASESPSQTDILYALRLQALLATKASRDALILGRALLQSPGQIGQSLLATAYKGAIEASLQLKDWRQADAFTEAFLATYPDDPALPDILFMSARTAAARKDWTAALKQVGLLLAAYPDNTSLRSWQILEATWLLSAGRAAEALQQFSACTVTSPAAWQPFLTFQIARCREALKELDAAGLLYNEVARMPGVPSSLREFAQTTLLKLHLRQLDEPAFQKELALYRKTWPAGMNRLMVENLAGSFFQRSGDLEQAVKIFRSVAAENGPYADYAHGQLSQLYRHDDDNLRRHALEWISSALAGGNHLPATPFEDCQIYQERSGRRALPEATVKSLFEAIEAGNFRLPTTPFLEILRQKWPAYKDEMETRFDDIRDWAESLANTFHREANWPARVAYQLYAAHLFELSGRQDSADTRRIQLIHSLEVAALQEAAAFTLAKTAQAYDFPEAESMLQGILARFPDSTNRPESLFLLAKILRRKNDPEKACPLLQEILSEWPDAAVHKTACLKLAAWQMEDAQPEAALEVLAEILDSPGLPAGQTARALLLRARADFETGHRERGLMDCFRILTLYPDLQATTIPAFSLLVDQLTCEEELTQRENLRERMLTSAPEYVLSHFQFTGA